MSQYSTLPQLFIFGFREDARGDASDEVLLAHLVAASGVVDGHLWQRYGTPFSSWTEEVTRWVCAIAALTTATVRGIGAETPDYLMLKDAHDRALSFLRRTQQQDYHPLGLVVAAGPGAKGVQPLVLSRPARGW